MGLLEVAVQAEDPEVPLPRREAGVVQPLRRPEPIGAEGLAAAPEVVAPLAVRVPDPLVMEGSPQRAVVVVAAAAEASVAALLAAAPRESSQQASLSRDSPR